MCPAHATAAALCCEPTADSSCVLPQELYPVTSKTAGTSNYTTPLNHAGVYYFVCQEGTHCIQGQVSAQQAGFGSAAANSDYSKLAPVVVEFFFKQAVCHSAPHRRSAAPSLLLCLKASLGRQRCLRSHSASSPCVLRHGPTP